MNRRHVLSSIGTTTGTLLAGCLTDDSGEPMASPALVEIANKTGEPIEIEVAARKNDTAVYDERYTIREVRVTERDDIGEYADIDGVQIAEDWMAIPAEYEFEFRIPQHGLEATFSSTDSIGEYDNAHQSELDGECYFVQVTIGDEAQPDTARVDATPERILVGAEVYHHDIFDRSHAGDCT
ncbi:uncharacterized protein Nmag_0702 [Natrialba magadii ATCC 43099]|nr:uncharacterized protein Nmag_0702 [Natrialba magadii ATCC 43099]